MSITDLTVPRVVAALCKAGVLTHDQAVATLRAENELVYDPDLTFIRDLLREAESGTQS